MKKTRSSLCVKWVPRNLYITAVRDTFSNIVSVALFIAVLPKTFPRAICRLLLALFLQNFVFTLYALTFFVKMAHEIKEKKVCTLDHIINESNRLCFRPHGWERTSGSKRLFFPLSGKAITSLVTETGKLMMAKKQRIIKNTNYKLNQLERLAGKRHYFKNAELGNSRQFLSLKTFPVPSKKENFAVSFWLTNEPFNKSDFSKPSKRKLSVKYEELEAVVEDALQILRKLRNVTSPQRRRSTLGGSSGKENAQPRRHSTVGDGYGKENVESRRHEFKSSSPRSRRAEFQSPPPKALYHR